VSVIAIYIHTGVCTVIGIVHKIDGRRQLVIGNPASIYPVYVDTSKCYFSTCSGMLTVYIKVT